MKKIIIIIMIAIIAAILSGCIDDVPAQPQVETKKSTVTEIKSEAILNSGYNNYKVIHDNELNQTCTIYLYDRGTGISCIPDSQLYESGHYGR